MRGMTLLETLLAVALLAMVAIAVATWTRLVADTEAVSRPRIAGTAAVAAALRQIDDDLRCGDLASGRVERRGQRAPRVQVDGQGQLAIETRTDGPATHVYAFDPRSGRLQLEALGSAHPRPLVEGLNRWEVSFDKETKILAISWSRGADAGLRRWVIQ